MDGGVKSDWEGEGEGRGVPQADSDKREAVTKAKVADSEDQFQDPCGTRQEAVSRGTRGKPNKLALA